MAEDGVGSAQAFPGAREIRIERVPDCPVRMRVTFLSAFDGIFIHFRQGQQPCNEDYCPKNLHALPVKWRGYAPVEIWATGPKLWVPAVLELTERLYWYVFQTPLRGTVWDVYRRPGRNNYDECCADFIEAGDPKPLRTDVEWRECVRRRYQNQPLHWGKVPQLGQPQVLAPRAGVGAPGEVAPVEQQSADGRSHNVLPDGRPTKGVKYT